MDRTTGMARGRRPAASCGDCGRSWPASARFCGRCGQLLRPRSPDPHRRRIAPLGLGAVAAVAVAALLTTTLSPDLAKLRRSGPSPGSDGTAASTDGDVTVDTRIPVGRGLAGQEAAAALSPFGEEPARCRPLGCERWWLAGEVHPVTPARLDGRLVLAMGDGVRVVDPETGTTRWTAPMSSLRPDPRTGWRLRPAELVLDASETALVIWAPRGYLQVRDVHGTERWSLTLPNTRRLWGVEATDEVVLVASATDTGAGPVEVVTAYDAGYGTVRWRQRVRWTYGLGPEGALVRDRDDRVTMLGIGSGSASYHLDVDDPRWVVHRGAFLVARVGARQVVVFDRRTGDRQRVLDDVAQVVDVGTDGTIALSLSGWREGTEGDQPARIVAIGPDGQDRWEHEVGCCARFAGAPPGLVAVRIDGSAPPRVLDGADGTVLAPLPGGTAGEPEWLDEDLVTAADARSATLVDRSGARLVLDGDRPRVLPGEPLVATFRDGLLGLDPGAAAPWPGTGRTPVADRLDRQLASAGLRDRGLVRR
jgi:hypothetical protein